MSRTSCKTGTRLHARIRSNEGTMQTGTHFSISFFSKLKAVANKMFVADDE